MLLQQLPDAWLDDHAAGTRAIGQIAALYAGLPDDELTEPTGYPPIAVQIGRPSPRAPRFAVIEHP